jgi:hypothetical protein
LKSTLKTTVGNERLWEFIMYALRKTFPETDYTRAIDVNKLAKVWPDQVLKLNTIIAEKVANIVGESAQEHKEILSFYNGKDEDSERGMYPGFIEVDKYESMMREEFNDLLEEDGDLGPALIKIGELTEELENGKADDEDEDE